MRKHLIIVLSVFMTLGFLVIPHKAAAVLIIPPGGTNAANAINCPQKGFAASFSFASTTLVRGQNNTVTFTVNNTSGPGNEFNSVAFAVDSTAKTIVKEPAEGVGGPAIATGPWQIVYVDGTDTQSEYPGYGGLVWTTVAEINDTGYAPIKPCTNETFTTTIFVPKTAALGNLNTVVLGAKMNIKDPVNASQVADQYTTFQIVDSASSTLTTLPKTGVETAATAAILGLAFALPMLRRRFLK